MTARMSTSIYNLERRAPSVKPRLRLAVPVLQRRHSSHVGAAACHGLRKRRTTVPRVSLHIARIWWRTQPAGIGCHCPHQQTFNPRGRSCASEIVGQLRQQLQKCLPAVGRSGSRLIVALVSLWEISMAYRAFLVCVRMAEALTVCGSTVRASCTRPVSRSVGIRHVAIRSVQVQPLSQ